MSFCLCPSWRPYHWVNHAMFKTITNLCIAFVCHSVARKISVAIHYINCVPCAEAATFCRMIRDRTNGEWVKFITNMKSSHCIILRQGTTDKDRRNNFGIRLAEEKIQCETKLVLFWIADFLHCYSWKTSVLCIATYKILGKPQSSVLLCWSDVRWWSSKRFQMV